MGQYYSWSPNLSRQLSFLPNVIFLFQDAIQASTGYRGILSPRLFLAMTVSLQIWLLWGILVRYFVDGLSIRLLSDILPRMRETEVWKGRRQRSSVILVWSYQSSVPLTWRITAGDDLDHLAEVVFVTFLTTKFLFDFSLSILHSLEGIQ